MSVRKKVIRLSGDEHKKLRNAIISAYPAKVDLEIMVKEGLEENLNAIAGGENLTQVVFNLIKWAEARGELEKLITAAYNKNSGNPELQEFYVFFEQRKQQGIKKQQKAPTAFGLPLRIFKFETVTVDAKGEIVKRDSNKEAKFFEEDLGNGVTLEMVSIPGGSFKMGSSPGEKQRSQNEEPQHTVNVPAFFMGKFEVTQEQYQKVMKKNPSRFKGNKRPVERVSWHNAVEFCKKLSQKTRCTYRLPSEAEWEYACRAGITTPFHFGETITDELANYRASITYASEPKGEYRGETTPVGKFPPNSFGLYDMHGNVWEWCQDTWHNNYNGAPKNGSAWIDNNNRCRVLRGGSWIDNPDYCRSAYRNIIYQVYDYDLFGLRVVCSVAPGTFK
ncbi:MAG: formylglycine-generating enzyme family protein [Rivularia sp. (in: Bacteria)]|nr:formylglycine-generating enzyme family protein [Rivularia sp. MS3]